MTGTTYAPVETADSTLVAAARRGDLHAWERIVRRHQEAVYRVCWLIVRDSDLAREAAGSTFVRAYRALPSYDSDGDLMPWLIRIAAGESRQQRRESGRPKRSSRPPEKEHSPHYPATPVPGVAEATGLTTHATGAITQAYDRLGEEDRLVLATRFLLGLDRDQAAGALSISTGLLDERLDGALGRLRTRIAGT